MRWLGRQVGRGGVVHSNSLVGEGAIFVTDTMYIV